MFLPTTEDLNLTEGPLMYISPFRTGHLVYVNDSTSLLEAHGSGRVASLISVESGHSIGTSMSVLR